MSDRDEFGEDDSEAADYEFLGRVDMDDDGRYQADVFRNNDAEEGDDLRLDLDAMFDLLGVDLNDQDILLDLLTQRIDPEAGNPIDLADKNTRGGYDREEVLRFLNETGWWGIADVYYDAELEEYFIEINYGDGATP